MADKQLLVVLGFKAEGAGEAKRAFGEVSAAAEDFTKKLRKADFDQLGMTDAWKRLANSDFGTGAKKLQTATQQIAQSVALTRQQALALTYTFNDVTASLASGASPFTILLQQGGQLTQAFGGVGSTLKSLLPIALRLAPAIAAVAAAAAAFYGLKAADDVAKNFEQIGKQAEASGLPLRKFQTLVAAGAAVGADQGDVVSGLERVADSARKAIVAQDEYNKKVRDLRNSVSAGVEGADKELAALLKTPPENVFDKLKISLAGFKSGATDAFDIVKQLIAELNKRSGFDRTNFLAEVKSAFGGGIADIVKSDARAVDNFVKALDKLAPPITNAQLQAAKTQRTLSSLLDLANARVSDQFGAAFLPASAELRRLQLLNFSSFLPAAREFGDVLAEIFRVLNGDRAARERNPSLTEFVNGLSAAKTAAIVAAEVIGSAFKSTFDAILIVSGVVADTINDVFGTQFTAGSTAATAAIGIIVSSMLGLNGVIIRVAKAFAGFALSTALNPLVASILLAGAALSFVLANWELISKGVKNLGEEFDTIILGRFRVWLSYLDAALKFRPWDTKPYEDALAQAQEADKRNADAVEALIADRVEQERRALDSGKTVWTNWRDYVKGIVSDVTGVVGSELNSAFNRANQSAPRQASIATAATEEAVMDAVRNEANARIRALRSAQQAISGVEQSTAQSAQATADATVRILRGAQQETVQVAREAESGVRRIADSINATAKSTENTFLKITDVRWAATVDNAVATSNEFVRAANGSWARVEQSAQNAESAARRAKDAASQAAAPQAAQVADPVAKIAEVQTASATAAREIRTQFENVGAGISTSFDAAIAKFQQLKQELATASSSGAATPVAQGQQGEQAAGFATALVASVQQSAQAVAQAFATLNQTAGAALAELLPTLQTLVNASFEAVSTSVQGAALQIQSAIQAIVEAIRTATQETERLGQAAQSVGQAAAPGGGRFASGGLVRGPGTSTSDSIPAWLSSGEFVVRAAAVRRYGADLLHQINGLRIPPSAALGRFAFADGGLVPSIATAMQPRAGGDGRNVTLVIDGRSFSGLSAPATVVDDLERFTTLRRISSTTKRAPSRIG